MDPELAAALLGLAAADSLNSSTLTMVIVIIVGARRPAGTGAGFAIGAIGAFFALATGLLYGAEAADAAVAGFGEWVRSIVLVGLGVVLGVLGVRRFRDRPRRGLPTLPTWVNPWSAVGLGAVATVHDLPNAFPLFLAIERLLDAGITGGRGVAVLVGYTAVYAFPALTLLVAGIAYQDRVTEFLARRLRRFTTGTARAHPKLALLYLVGAAASLTLAVV